MATSIAEKMIRELSIGGKINLESVYLKGEESGVKRELLADAVGRLASEGVIKKRLKQCLDLLRTSLTIAV